MSQQYTIPKEHKAAVCEGHGKGLVVKTVPTPQPSDEQVLIKVSASSICHSDTYVVDGGFPGVSHPAVPGHECIGRIVATGKNVGDQFKIGQLAGLGWNGGYCSRCDACRNGEFFRCHGIGITGITLPGGHQEYVTAHWSAVVKLPDDTGIDVAELAPILCAGLTVNDALRKGGAKAGDKVIIQGVGGLGSLGLQFARKSGFYVIAISGSEGKRQHALDLGANEYYTAKEADEKLSKTHPDIKVAVATAPSAAAISSVLKFLGPQGSLVIVGLPSDGKDLNFAAGDLVVNRKTVHGLTCGTSINNEHLIQFATQGSQKIKSTIQKRKLEDCQDAYTESVKGNPQHRNVFVF
ncbi:unnamed protein product [Sympodiomycopsis kandeliae]